MKHIDFEYGSGTNLLELTSDQLVELEPFLNALGVKVRTTRYCAGVHVIQAENPYKFWISQEDRRYADKDMTPDALRVYKY